MSSESVLEEARVALLSALVGEPPVVSPPVREAVVHLVTNPDLLLWDALWREPLECLRVAFSFDLSEEQLATLVRRARLRLQPAVLLDALGSHTRVRDRLSQQVLWQVSSGGGYRVRIPRQLVLPLSTAPGRLTRCNALALWHLGGHDPRLVVLAAAALVTCPDGVLEVLATLARDDDAALSPAASLERFVRQVELGSLLEDVPVSPDLERFRGALAAL